jgi:hypothetical protein
LPVLYTAIEQRPKALELLESVEVLREASITISPITDDIQASRAAEMRAQANQLAKDLDAERLETTSGLRLLVERLNTRFNPAVSFLQGLVKSIDKAVLAHMNEKARKQRAEREALEAAQRADHERLRAEAAALNVEPPPPPPPVVMPPSASPFKITGSHGAALGQRDNWKWRVTDISKVPESLLVAPAERIEKAAMNSLAKSRAKTVIAALQLGPNDAPPTVLTDAIPGIELYNDAGLSSRTL